MSFSEIQEFPRIEEFLIVLINGDMSRNARIGENGRNGN